MSQQESRTPESVPSNLSTYLVDVKTPSFGPELITHLEELASEEIPGEFRDEEFNSAFRIDAEVLQSKISAVQGLSYPTFDQEDLDRGIALFRQHLGTAFNLLNSSSKDSSNLYSSYVRAHSELIDAATVLRLVLRK